MYDDIAYRKDDIYRRSVYVLEYAISMTPLHRERTIFKNIVYVYCMTTVK